MTEPMTAHIDDEDRQWAANLIFKNFHDEFCEYDGVEDGVDVCAGECREFAEALTGLAPNEEAAG